MGPRIRWGSRIENKVGPENQVGPGNKNGPVNMVGPRDKVGPPINFIHIYIYIYRGTSVPRV